MKFIYSQFFKFKSSKNSVFQKIISKNLDLKTMCLKTLWKIKKTKPLAFEYSCLFVKFVFSFVSYLIKNNWNTCSSCLLICFKKSLKIFKYSWNKCLQILYLKKSMILAAEKPVFLQMKPWHKNERFRGKDRKNTNTQKLFPNFSCFFVFKYFL